MVTAKNKNKKKRHPGCLAHAAIGIFFHSVVGNQRQRQYTYNVLQRRCQPRPTIICIFIGTPKERERKAHECGDVTSAKRALSNNFAFVALRDAIPSPNRSSESRSFNASSTRRFRLTMKVATPKQSAQGWVGRKGVHGGRGRVGGQGGQEQGSTATS